MADTLKSGDHVEWDAPQGKTTGTVKKKLTEPTQIKGHKVAASPEHPEYLVETGKSHKEAAHTVEELHKKAKK